MIKAILSKISAILASITVAIASLVSPTPAPSPEPTSLAMESPSPSPSPTPTGSQELTVQPTSQPTSTPVPSVSPAPLSTPTPTPNPIIEITRQVEELKQIIAAITPEPTPSPTPVSTPSPSLSTPTPDPTYYMGDITKYNLDQPYFKHPLATQISNVKVTSNGSSKVIQLTGNGAITYSRLILKLSPDIESTGNLDIHFTGTDYNCNPISIQKSLSKNNGSYIFDWDFPKNNDWLCAIDKTTSSFKLSVTPGSYTADLSLILIDDSEIKPPTNFKLDY